MQPSNIDQFLAQISSGRGFAKASLYYVEIPYAKKDREKIGFLCRSVTLPSRQLMTIPREIGPDREDIVYGYQNGTVSMTFRVLNDQKSRHFFESWQGKALAQFSEGTDGDYSTAFPDKYAYLPVHIYQLEKGWSAPVYNRNKKLSVGPFDFDIGLDIDFGLSGKANYHWVLDRAYPVTFQSETLSDDGKDQISEVTVEFQYKNWKGEKISDDRKIGLTSAINIQSNVGSKIGNKIYDLLN